MRVRRALVSVAAVHTAALVLAACAPQPLPVDATTPTPTLVPGAASAGSEPAAEQITFVSVIDGDTIETSAGTVRIIGIDTPERGECGNDAANAAIESQLAPGDTVTLELPSGENDQDQYGRLIRYVTTAAGVDLGLLQLQAGNAVARYDSSDDYPAHPREADYHAAQLATLSEGSVITVACQPPAVLPPPASADRWWEQYSSCTKLKNNTVGHRTGPFNRDDPTQAEPYDWFANRTGNNGDGDRDGLACE
jgi:endonuclease YncB( thermonuclease family)